jgi:hypothetical protein
VVNRFGEAVGVRFDIAADVAVAAVAGGFLGVLDALLLGELAQECLAHDVG